VPPPPPAPPPMHTLLRDDDELERDISANVVRVVDCVCTSELLNGDIGLL